jgi:hypothetical protein
MGARIETIRWLEESELGGQISVDLEADANFDESRGRPSHAFLLACAHNERLFEAV